MPKVLQTKRITGNQFIGSFVTAHFGQDSVTISPANLQDVSRIHLRKNPADIQKVKGGRFRFLQRLDLYNKRWNVFAVVFRKSGTAEKLEKFTKL